MVKMLVQNDPSSNIHVDVLITGMPGYGKSTLAKALCHLPPVKKCFSTGFVWIQLGPVPQMRPAAMLLIIYNKLTGKQWNPVLTNVQVTLNEEETIASLSQILQDLCRNEKLLVIIDDLWEIKDIHTYIEAFCSCKIVITTRRNDIQQFYDCKCKIYTEGMTAPEAINLLTIKQFQPLNSATIDKLNQLAEDLHYWPLLLNLVHAQFQGGHSNRIPYASSVMIIEHASRKLVEYGLTAFDPKIKKLHKEMAAAACIKASLDWLEKENLIRLIRLVATFAFGDVFPMSLVCYLWKTDSDKATKCCEALWSVGLLSFAKLPYTTGLESSDGIEVHSIITQYIFDNEIERGFGDPYDYMNELNLQQSLLFKHMTDFVNNTASTVDKVHSFVRIIDSLVVSFAIKIMPVVSQALLKILANTGQDPWLNNRPLPKVKKSTFIQLIMQYKSIILLLDNDKVDEAIAIVNKEVDIYYQYLHHFFLDIPATRWALDKMFTSVIAIAKHYFLYRKRILNAINNQQKLAEIVKEYASSIPVMSERDEIFKVCSQQQIEYFKYLERNSSRT